MTKRTGKPLVVGLTGGIGSGKTAVSDRLAGLGAAIVDTDVIARELTGPGGAAIQSLRDAFGAAFIAADGSLDRTRMRDTVFADPAAKARLEGVLHPMIRSETQRRVEAAGAAPYVVLVVPLLVESGDYRRRVDHVVVVDCPVELQIERTMRRSALSRESVERILRNQASREQRLAAADDVISNAGPIAQLDEAVRALHERLQRRAAARASGIGP